MPSKAHLDLDAFTPYRLSVLTNRVSGAIARHYSSRFGLTIAEWRVMAVLGQIKSGAPGLSARQVAERTAMDKVQVSRAVQALLAARRITRAAHARDGRVAHLALSAQGLAIYNEVVPFALALEKQFLSVLTAAERKAFDALLAKLSDGITDTTSFT
ncbi:MAG: MarR family transcriptional regulator [Alphaproteobacteria bacterium]|nr:MarR family transcriptional regulator [Alphaproteobacteria bacterium]